jgi:high-affinity K+ transport system ATPase subunit B
MKRVIHDFDAKDPLLHIETQFGIINIRTQLKEGAIRDIEAIEILPDDGVIVEGSCKSIRLFKYIP